MRIAAQAGFIARTSAATSMGKTKAPDDKSTPARAAQLRRSDQPLMEERRTIIAEYANYLREILKRLRERLH
jgi:hypothetical protein